MSEPVLKCANCQKEIPVGKYYEVQEKGGRKIESYCSPCWTKEPKFEFEIKNGTLILVEVERERERERESKMNPNARNVARTPKVANLRLINETSVRNV